MIYCVKELIKYFNDRDNSCIVYDPEWSIGARIINGAVWYECYYKVSDTLKSEYDYSSMDLRGVLEYMNSCTGDVIYY